MSGAADDAIAEPQRYPKAEMMGWLRNVCPQFYYFNGWYSKFLDDAPFAHLAVVDGAAWLVRQKWSYSAYTCRRQHAPWPCVFASLRLMGGFYLRPRVQL